MKKILLASILIASLLNSSEIKQEQTVNNETNQSSNVTSNTPQCTYFGVERVDQLNIRDKPGKPSKIVGRANRSESICIYEFEGKWGRSDRGWLSMKYLQKDSETSNFLLADIDNDGKKERLQWELTSKPGEYENRAYQVKLLDDDGSLFWQESTKDNDNSIVGPYGEESKYPVVFSDIDGDGNTEVIVWHVPHEAPESMFRILRWNGKKFTEVKKSKHNIDLVWTDAPKGKTLKWTSSSSKRKKIWLAVHLWQREKNELPIVTIVGYDKTSYSLFSYSKAKIRFTPTGAVIEEWIK